MLYILNNWNDYLIKESFNININDLCNKLFLCDKRNSNYESLMLEILFNSFKNRFIPLPKKGIDTKGIGALYFTSLGNLETIKEMNNFNYIDLLNNHTSKSSNKSNKSNKSYNTHKSIDALILIENNLVLPLIIKQCGLRDPGGGQDSSKYEGFKTSNEFSINNKKHICFINQTFDNKYDHYDKILSLENNPHLIITSRIKLLKEYLDSDIFNKIPKTKDNFYSYDNK